MPRFRLLLFLVFCCSALAHAQPQDIATIDLRAANWNSGKTFTLGGSWDFVWKELIYPGKPRETQWSPMPVPGPWNAPDETRTGFGYATYRLNILVPDNTNSLFLALPDMASAYQLWVNGKYRAGNGVVATSKELETPEYGPNVLQVEAIDGKIAIYLLTSNFHYQWGGLWYSPRLTDQSGVFSLREGAFIEAAIFSTLLLATGLLALLLFIFRRKDRKVFYFSMLCFVIGLRRLLIDERILHGVEWLNWHSLQALENMSIYLALPLLISYIKHLFPLEFSSTLARTAWLISLPFCLAALTLDVSSYTQLNIPFQILSLCFIPPVFYCYLKALKARRKGAKMFGLSLLVFACAAINDALNYSYLIATPNLIHIGTLAFVLFQLGSLVSRYLKNFHTIEEMSAQLQDQNIELKRMDEFKDEFLAMTSHELRTPLHMISGLARLISKENRLSETQTQKLKMIEASSERLNNLVNDILDTSSIKHGKLSLDIQPFDILPLIDAVITSMQPLLTNKPVTLNRQEQASESQNQVVMADPQRIQQILVNLLGNAIKFTESGQIEVGLSTGQDQLLVKVHDSGIGIPDHLQNTLFEPFEAHSQGHDTTYQSTGLGLSVSKQLAELQNGSLSLVSEPGSGTTVTLSIPLCTKEEDRHLNRHHHQGDPQQGFVRNNQSHAYLVTQDENTALTDNTCTSSSDAESLDDVAPDRELTPLIYYADDEAINLEMLKSYLADCDFRIETFGNAKELIERCRDKEPDLILLDLMMPGMHGIEACQFLRQKHNAAHLPIIMLTARHQTTDIVAALQAGANDYLTKPYAEQELHARILSQLSVRKLWLSELEKRRIKEELRHKEHLQRQLEKANHRLSEAVNVSNEALLVVDSELTILNTNDCTAKLFKTPFSAIEHEQLESFLDDQAVESITRLIKHKDSDGMVNLSIYGSDYNARLVKVETSLSDENFYILSLKEKQKAPEISSEAFQALAAELSASRHRIEEIEQAIAELAPKSTEKAEHSLTRQSKASLEVGATNTRQELIVKAMRMSLLAWERSTHETKVELAEKSHCWSVYLDGTTAKTRTLDKYLSVKTLPAKPRWRSVVNTLKFVMNHCNLNEDEHEELRRLVEEIDLAFA